MIKILFFVSMFMLSNMNTQAQKYIFFLHNRYLQEFGLESVHAEYGKVEYQEILSAFKKHKFNVISEVRPKNTNWQDYTQKVKNQIDSLLTIGIKPYHITVVGTSMGDILLKQYQVYLKTKA